MTETLDEIAWALLKLRTTGWMPDPNDDGQERFVAPTNRQRAEHVDAVMQLYEALTGNDDVTDLLADMLHYADRYGYDFTAGLEKARYQHEIEIEMEARA